MGVEVTALTWGLFQGPYTWLSPFTGPFQTTRWILPEWFSKNANLSLSLVLPCCEQVEIHCPSSWYAKPLMVWPCYLSRLLSQGPSVMDEISFGSVRAQKNSIKGLVDINRPATLRHVLTWALVPGLPFLSFLLVDCSLIVQNLAQSSPSLTHSPHTLLSLTPLCYFLP